MLTAFGKELRKLRISVGELIRDMATKLGVTASYLSAVETGKRHIPSDWILRISELYNLSADEKDMLQKAADASASSIKLNLDGMNTRRRQTAVLFAREFGELDEQKVEQIRMLLGERGE
ncbi:MAG: helix-turn-helix transcriptional regulator [Clostridia bacterium]|nr:helix-turn-helix transcriptional regulator [Clostridia bacterium]